MAIAIWKTRTASMLTNDNYIEAAREYVEWLDYIAANIGAGTSREDRDALVERWICSKAYMVVAYQERAQRLDKAVNALDTLVCKACRNYELGLDDGVDFWTEYNAAYENAQAELDACEEFQRRGAWYKESFEQFKQQLRDMGALHDEACY